MQYLYTLTAGLKAAQTLAETTLQRAFEGSHIAVTVLIVFLHPDFLDALIGDFIMTKTYLVLLLTLLFPAGVLLAQNTGGDNLGDITFEDLKDKEKSSQYFAVGGGFTGSFLMFNEDSIYNELPGVFQLSKFKSPLFVTGGQGFVTFFFKNIRLGFSAGIGTQTVESVVKVANVPYRRRVDFSSSYNGITIDYAIPIASKFTILPGVQAGFGSKVFERYDGIDSLTSWKNVKPDSALMFNSRLESSQGFLQPVLNIEYALTSYTMLRANVGYNLELWKGTWTLNRTTILGGAPSLNANGLIAGFGVFIGLFRNE